MSYDKNSSSPKLQALINSKNSKTLNNIGDLAKSRLFLGEEQDYYSRTQSGLLTAAKITQLSKVGIFAKSNHYHKGLVTTVLKTPGRTLNLEAIKAHIDNTDLDDEAHELLEEVNTINKKLTEKDASTLALIKERNKRLVAISTKLLPKELWNEIASTEKFIKNTAPYVGIYKINAK